MNEHPTSQAREVVIKFLYQCEIEKLFYFSDNHFNSFVTYFEISKDVVNLARVMCKGVLDQQQDIDEKIEGASVKWRLTRMASTDRAILRLATYELQRALAPPKVVINEAIELAKRFGTEKSGVFVNGVLDQLAQKLRRFDQNQSKDTS